MSVAAPVLAQGDITQKKHKQVAHYDICYLKCTLCQGHFYKTEQLIVLFCKFYYRSRIVVAYKRVLSGSNVPVVFVG